MVQRLVRKTDPIDLNNPEDGEPKPFSSFLRTPNLILLGDPGAGKSHTFEAAAELEEAKFFTARKFLAYEGEGGAGKPLYVDALDEFRSRTGDTNSIAEIIKLLRRLKPTKFRLSCRVADWLGESDLSLFRPYFDNSGGFVVVSLEPLTDLEIIPILEGRDVDDPKKFFLEAELRGLEGLLRNPQTLLMLIDVVGNGNWPATKFDLYERSTSILLSEHGEIQQRLELGRYNTAELLDPVGAAFACILISDVGGLSLLENSKDDLFPSYRGVPVDDVVKVQSALTRRACVALGNEKFTYVHRTIAEFLAAKWIARRVRSGLPLSRIRNLIGIEGIPAPELRGLHAWLATVLPENAESLIAADPYGVLAYGDAASFSPTSRQALIRSLERLARDDPWFRSGDRTAEPLGALSGADMVGPFRKILSGPDSTYQLKSLVLDSIRYGPSLPQARDDLLAILVAPTANLSQRIDAFEALLRVVPGGRELLIQVFRERLVGEPSSALLRAKILTRLYGDDFGPADIVAIFRDILHDKNGQLIGRLWDLTHSIAVASLPDVLDGLCDLREVEKIEGRSETSHELEWAFSDLLVRILHSDLPIEPKRLWKWLNALYWFRGRAGGGPTKIREWLNRHPRVVLDMFEMTIREFDSENSFWRYWGEFRDITMHTIEPLKIAEHAFEMMSEQKVDLGVEAILYELSLSLVFSAEPESAPVFDRIFEFANGKERLVEIRDRTCKWDVHDWHRESSERKREYDRERKEGRAKNKEEFAAQSDRIRAGKHLGWLIWIGKVYFGQFSDIDREAAPAVRLQTELGDEFAALAIEGLISLLKTHELPNVEKVAGLDAQGKASWWWYAVLAGMDECWARNSEIMTYSEETLASVLAIELALPTFEDVDNERKRTSRGWKEALFRQRPEFVTDVYVAFARVGLAKRTDHLKAITVLTTDGLGLFPDNQAALDLLEEFPNAAPYNLKSLIFAAISDQTCHSHLRKLSRKTLNSKGRVRLTQRSIWLATVFLLAFDEFKDAIEKYGRSRELLIWTLRDFVDRVRVGKENKPFDLSTAQAEFLIRIVGERFSNEFFPIGSGGWRGDQNTWDAAELVRKQIENLSARPDIAASEALGRLVSNKKLKTYRDHLRHALANQAMVRRESEFYQPNWMETVNVLSGGMPINIPDLHALVLDHFETLAAEIRLSNTDIYKEFWNEDDYGRITQPKIEDSCRDRLIDLLERGLVPLGVRAEPEGHMVADKQADIVLLPPPGQKLPLELKRDTHSDLWTACETQLDRLYARDPEAAGYGIYVVFWFGDKRNGRIPKPPAGINRPKSPIQLRESLQSMIPDDKRHCLDVFVIDVTPPALPKAQSG